MTLSSKSSSGQRLPPSPPWHRAEERAEMGFLLSPLKGSIPALRAHVGAPGSLAGTPAVLGLSHPSALLHAS